MTETSGEHASPLHQLMAKEAGAEYVCFGSLAEAQAADDGCVLLEGDDGGQLYVVVPARDVHCDEAALQTLLRDLDAIAWPDNDEDAARVVYVTGAVGTGVAGGMGGGRVEEGGWIHPTLATIGVELEVREVLSGTRDRLSAAVRASGRS